MSRPHVRLAALFGGLVAAFLVFTVAGPVSEREVRDWLEPLGVLAPLGFIALATVLGALLVPGPLLAAASGLLFGTVLGTAVTLCSACGTAVVALLIGRGMGARAAEQVAGERYAEIAARLRRHGVMAVVMARLVPGVPDGPVSYVAGVIGLRVVQIAAGTAIGALPRAFSYTALGDSVGDPPGALLAVALGVLVLTTVGGAVVARRAWARR